MSRNDPRVTLRQIADFARQAARLGEEGSRSLLETDWKYRLAAERAAELIGEAAMRLPEILRERHAEVPWRAIISFRNRLIHGYDGIDYEILWDVLHRHAPALIVQVNAIAAEIAQDDV